MTRYILTVYTPVGDHGYNLGRWDTLTEAKGAALSTLRAHHNKTGGGARLYWSYEANGRFIAQTCGAFGVRDWPLATAHIGAVVTD